MAKTRIVRLLRNGQITIPKEFREALGLGPDDLVGITLTDGTLGISRMEAAPQEQGSPWLKELYDVFAPVRQSFVESGMTEDEINAELDAALREAREERDRERRAAS
jgi:AbrB family looped-hinge helix DNA binding protein